MYEFKEEFLTGIELIDREHRRLFEIANELYELKCRHILEELRDYTLTHFEHEEEYMKSIGYKRMFTQLTQHNALRETINNWDLDAIDENQDETIEEMLGLITDWLVNHILSQDKLIGK